jgi:putative ABC transport system substrate-binding protein
VPLGYLLSVGPGYDAIFHRAVSVVDRLWKGAHPADLPVEQPTTFDVVLNLKVARSLGLAISPDVSAQVTEWVE